MKYQANPIVVDAFKIVEVLNAYRLAPGQYKPGDIIPTSESSTEFMCKLDDDSQRHATPQMCARMIPQVGDYWVVQSDGYEYLNPKDVFERKYSPVT